MMPSGSRASSTRGPSNTAMVEGLGADTVIDYTAIDITALDATFDVVLNVVSVDYLIRPVEVFAEGVENARMMRLSPGGDLLVSQPKLGRVLHVLRDLDGDGRLDVAHRRRRYAVGSAAMARTNLTPAEVVDYAESTSCASAAMPPARFVSRAVLGGAFLGLGGLLALGGGSEYLMNGRTCRLRDIHEMFMDTGLGSKA